MAKSISDSTNTSLVPSFSGVYGQEHLIEPIRNLIEKDTLPHALLITGKPGGEALPLALATAKRLLCSTPLETGDACGKCKSCRQVGNLEDPDLMLVFPLTKEGDAKEVTSGMVMPHFRKMVSSHPRFTAHEWKEVQNSGNRQMGIMVAEAEKITAWTALKSFKSQHQVVVIWLPETMRSDTANKLLKLFEEPPKGVHFICVSDSPESLLPTILSRFQRIRVMPIAENILREALIRDFGVEQRAAEEVAHLSNGNLYTALSTLGKEGGEEKRDKVRDEALSIIETALTRNPKKYLLKAEELSKMNRPLVLEVTDGLLGVLRECLALNEANGDFTAPYLYIPISYQSRIRQIAQLMPPTGYPLMMKQIASARQELQQNANVKILYFDLLIFLAQLFKKNH